jgi:hypothetical protein
MTGKEPVAELDARYSSDGVIATEWAQARRRLEDAEVFWLSTGRPDGRPASRRCCPSGWTARCTSARAKGARGTGRHGAALVPTKVHVSLQIEGGGDSRPQDRP